MVRHPLLPLLAALLLATTTHCDDGEGQVDAGKASGKETEHGLTEGEANKTLVEVGDATITVGEFADRLADQSPYLRARYNSPERRREFLDNMVRFELLALEAKRRGLDELPEVQRSAKQKMIQQMMKERFQEKIQLSDINDEAIETYYEEHRSEFHKPEQVRASHIQMDDRGEAREVLKTIKENADDVSKFRELADKHNEDPETEERQGDLRFFSKPQHWEEGKEPAVPKPVAEAAFELEEVGDLHPEVVRSDDGWHIVKLTGRRAGLERSLEQARRPIQNRLWRQKREKAVEDFVQELRKEAEVEESFEALDKVKLDVPEGGGAAAAPPNAKAASDGGTTADGEGDDAP